MGVNATARLLENTQIWVGNFALHQDASHQLAVHYCAMNAYSVLFYSLHIDLIPDES